jgi:hypothetical protein
VFCFSATLPSSSVRTCTGTLSLAGMQLRSRIFYKKSEAGEQDQPSAQYGAVPLCYCGRCLHVHVTCVCHSSLYLRLFVPTCSCYHSLGGASKCETHCARNVCVWRCRHKGYCVWRCRRLVLTGWVQSPIRIIVSTPGLASQVCDQFHARPSLPAGLVQPASYMHA